MAFEGWVLITIGRMRWMQATLDHSHEPWCTCRLPNKPTRFSSNKAVGTGDSNGGAVEAKGDTELWFFG
jgi:predicted outer membrane repeat protein